MSECLGVKPSREVKAKGEVTLDRSGYSLKDLSKSSSVGTRKMVNYA